MGMESIVKCIQHRITPMESEKGEINITRVFHKDDYKSLDAVITALENEKKYKKILEELEIYIEGKSEALTNKMNLLWQKYFPK